MDIKKPFYHHTNRINIPSWLFASRVYNTSAQEIHISGVNEYYGDIFRAISECGDISESCRIFESAMTELFNLDLRHRGKRVGSYLRLLKGWLFDSNNIEGAVLKGWVESRFGLVPFFHKEIIKDINCKEYYDYMVEKMNGRHNKNMMFHQLDLLYTYIQTMLGGYFGEYTPHVTLYRGVNNLEEHRIIERKSKREVCIEQNSLVSFTASREVAESFGDYILEVKVPYTKVFFFATAMPTVSFCGEDEFIILGGRYDTTIRYY
ncbi:NAD(+)--dinitrogen-reductase ADP-D-ribosyltransferase [Limisalsivibrio acetivorans]|uniref:NAD(+)--dinitrogen-reductase ADP-D-ribosyltransferase n=1 Tax=Limisalsivibrio acetivorans TaxID=1304888 RepID=UPI0003B38865|nr:NAD(+)--dinitrogen-reductase ADP-D-ribosyltransferase [Limisalsivibrio acetivorans]